MAIHRRSAAFTGVLLVVSFAFIGCALPMPAGAPASSVMPADAPTQAQREAFLAYAPIGEEPSFNADYTIVYLSDGAMLSLGMTACSELGEAKSLTRSVLDDAYAEVIAGVRFKVKPRAVDPHPSVTPERGESQLASSVMRSALRHLCPEVASMLPDGE